MSMPRWYRANIAAAVRGVGKAEKMAGLVGDDSRRSAWEERGHSPPAPAAVELHVACVISPDLVSNVIVVRPSVLLASCAGRRRHEDDDVLVQDRVVLYSTVTVDGSCHGIDAGVLARGVVSRELATTFSASSSVTCRLAARWTL
jgi:hypothetical protein